MVKYTRGLYGYKTIRNNDNISIKGGIILDTVMGYSKAKYFLYKKYKEVFAIVLFVAAMTIVANKNYILFHSIIDNFTVIVGFVITVIAYNTYSLNKNSFMGFLGIAYCSIAVLTFVHVLTYKGMNIIPNITANTPTQLWIISRYIQSVSLVISFRYINKELNFNKTLFTYGILTVLSIYLLFYTNIFPNCFVEEKGLTDFKKNSEYITMAILFIASIMLVINKRHFEKSQYNLIFTSFLLDILAGTMFTTYASVYGQSNMIGHILNFLSYYLIYKAIVKTNLKHPYISLNLANNKLNNKIEELKESNERYTKLVENTPNGILMHDDEKILYANEEALRIFNIETKQNLIGRNPDEFVHPKDKQEIENRREQLLNNNKVDFSFEHMIIDDKGIIKHVETTATAIYENGNKRILLMIKDISKRKHAEKQLRQNERTYSKLIELLPDGIFILHNGKYVYANKALVNILNAKSENELIGEHKDKFSKTVYEYEEVVFDEINKVIKHKETIPYIEDRIVRHDGQIIDLELSIMPFEVIGDGYVLVIARDITEKKKSQQLKQKYNERVYYDKLKTEFFANMSHELKTPLNVIYGSSQLLQSQSKKNNLKEENIDKYTTTINQNCFRLIRLINNIIDVTKMESGFYNIKRENYNIVSIVEDIALSITDYTSQKGIDLVFDTEVEEKIIAIDPDKMERVILNLLSNAIKFTNPYGKISVNIYDKEENIEISVKDTGVGIPEDKLNVIFERFGQVDKTIKRNKEGSGIGLSLVKSLVEHHEGKISVKSEFGRGSEFIITLPVIVLDEEIKEEEIIRTSNVERIHIEFSDIYA
jgi:PAS domain S-box-containing protein